LITVNKLLFKIPVFFIGIKTEGIFYYFSIKFDLMQPEDRLSIPDEIISVSNLVQGTTIARIREQLIPLINELINKDFHALVQLLYRIDVDEKKIKVYLNQNTNKDSAPLIADLIIERQLQKIQSRKYFSNGNNHQSEEEKW